MKAKIDAALDAVKPGSDCNACVVVSGSDYNCIRAILGKKHNAKFGEPKGTLFATPDTMLHEIALKELKAEKVSFYHALSYNFILLQVSINAIVT